MTATEDLPQLQFIRLTCAITVLWVGLTLEQATDQRAKYMIFLIMTSLICVKLYLEIQLILNPLDSDDNINNFEKLGKAILLSMIKTLQVF